MIRVKYEAAERHNTGDATIPTPLYYATDTGKAQTNEHQNWPHLFSFEESAALVLMPLWTSVAVAAACIQHNLSHLKYLQQTSIMVSYCG